HLHVSLPIGTSNTRPACPCPATIVSCPRLKTFAPPCRSPIGSSCSPPRPRWPPPAGPEPPNPPNTAPSPPSEQRPPRTISPTTRPALPAPWKNCSAHTRHRSTPCTAPQTKRTSCPSFTERPTRENQRGQPCPGRRTHHGRTPPRLRPSQDPSGPAHRRPRPDMGLPQPLPVFPSGRRQTRGQTLQLAPPLLHPRRRCPTLRGPSRPGLHPPLRGTSTRGLRHDGPTGRDHRRATRSRTRSGVRRPLAP